ncbi:ABC-F family ATP-binding cassette domain-containing protein [Phototrophicus methaneseepsis]|uniref:ABC-F family ATP-binding cassette domain-containing protein n=1 Tax=Phototrophicus methaneseepsis TaxID=2710758 RepID=A0A7S8E8W1_9CHLR|nr:ABC-F family ATP-binding cassette domain-containing protein [Phototrophicus methaneseepsis]QPC82540.1 ABC-F family ATP-binding cassette domain-containing protein [Phototrophicus methaneseepsis]
MNILELHHVRVNYLGRDIFTDITYALGDRDRIGLVGPNGAGKSTLIKLIMGMIAPESGHIVRHGAQHLGYLPQDIELPSGMTLLEVAMILPPQLKAIEAELAAIEAKLAEPEVYGHPSRLQKVLTEQEQVLARYDRLNGPRHASQVKKLLSILGFTAGDYDLPSESLSGGQKKLIKIVQLSVAAPNILLLDEPDNHLDVDGKQNLERFINQYPGCVLIVSHDRYLLDEVATKIIELENGKLTEYIGNYTAYTTEKELARLRQQQAYIAQQKEIARIEAAIARFELWASMVVDERHIKQARSRRKMLDRMEANGEIIEKVVDPRMMNLSITGSRGSKEALSLKELGMAFDDDLLFYDVNFLLRHGERVGLVGANGVGKSVLFKLILGQLQPYEGTVKIGPSCTVGYYSQEHQTLVPWLDRTPLDLIRDLKTGSEGQAVSFLTNMLFKYQQVRQPIRTLSGGERSRLQLAILMLQEPNLLLLDEPTNNLDIASVEVLEKTLDEFQGSILTISHDRYFLDRVVDRIIELRDGTLFTYEGGYTDYANEALKVT